MTAIKMFREKAELTQAKLAEMIGVSQPTVAMWEAGDRKPDIIMLKKLTSILGCSADDLLEPISVSEGS